MRLGKATHPPESVGEWERWASAWHLISNYREGAIERADEQIAALQAGRYLSGAEIWIDLRCRVLVLQAKSEAWPGEA